MSAIKPVQARRSAVCKPLRLPTVAAQFARLAEEAVKEKQRAPAFLEALLEAEVEERDHKAMARRIQEARFPAVKTLEEFDFQGAPHMPVTLMRNLSEGGYSDEGTGHFSGRNGHGEDALGDRVGGGRLPAAQAGAVHDGGGNGDRTDRSPRTTN